MIQLEKFVGGEVVVVMGWLTPTTYIQLTGAGSNPLLISLNDFKELYEIQNTG